ncbi:MAG: BspA family leucine-rich repeat surface protein [Lachnospiraceae bacterium]|nr:BspA family leucine-rich repeat surface protein [Lachnospiraceae bacterium]
MTDQSLKTILCGKCGALNSDHARWCRSCGATFPENPVRILPPGTILGRGHFTITAFLGQGGSALTYKARREDPEEEVVVREYYPEEIAMRDLDGYKVRPAGPDVEEEYEQGLEEFMDAGDMLRSLAGVPNMIRVRDAFTAYGTAYITGDYIDGLPLSAILQQKRRFTFDEALDCLQGVMKALIRVHEAGLIHGNINPSNIMVSNGEACLIDFSTGDHMAALQGHQNRKETGISRTGGYAAPEQMTGAAAEAAWTDVYGIAATLYRMITGDEPDDAGIRMNGYLLPPPADIVAGVTLDQSDVIMKGMALDTEERYQSMEEFLNALEACRENKKAATTREGTRKKSVHPLLPEVIVLILCILIGAAGLFAVSRFRPSGGSSSAGSGKNPPEEAESTEAVPEQDSSEQENLPGAESTQKVETKHLRADIGVSGDMRMGGNPNVNEYVFGNTSCRREDIEAVTFVNSLEGKPDTAWDVSEEGNGEVYAWVEGEHLFIGADGRISLPADCTGLFSFYTNVKTIDFGSGIDTSGVTDMTFMFKQDMQLTGLDLSGFDTSRVESTDRMFTQCRSIKSLDLSGFDTSVHTNMLGMFAHCVNLTDLDVSSFDTSKVTTMAFLFYNCSAVRELDIRSFDTSLVRSGRCMFLDCKDLKDLYFDPEKFRTGSMTDMHSMFNSCSSLTTLDVSSFDTGNVTDMAYMFYMDGSLTELAFENFDMSRVEKKEDMLTGTLWEE